MALDEQTEERVPERDLYIAILDHVLSGAEERDLVDLITLVLLPAPPEEKLRRWMRDAL